MKHHSRIRDNPSCCTSNPLASAAREVASICQWPCAAESRCFLCALSLDIYYVCIFIVSRGREHQRLYYKHCDRPMVNVQVNELATSWQFVKSRVVARRMKRQPLTRAPNSKPSLLSRLGSISLLLLLTANNLNSYCDSTWLLAIGQRRNSDGLLRIRTEHLACHGSMCSEKSQMSDFAQTDVVTFGHQPLHLAFC